MVLGGQMDYPIAHPQPGSYNTGYGQPGSYNTGYGQPGGYGSGYSQPYQPTNLGGYPYMGYGNLGGSENGHYNGDNSSSLQEARLYPNTVAPLPSKHQMVAPEGYNKHSYNHGMKPQGYNPHGYEKPSKNDYYGNSHGYEKPSKHDYYGSSHGDYEKHGKADYYGNNNHGGYDKHSNGGHEGYGNGKYPSHGANRVESMSYNYYSSNGQENKSHDWILKGLDD